MTGDGRIMGAWIREIRFIRIEGRRILTPVVLLIYFAAVIVLSVNSSRRAVSSYEVRSTEGLVADGAANLEHGREHAEKKEIGEAAAALKKLGRDAQYIDETSVQELLRLVYPDKSVQELTEAEAFSVLDVRLDSIRKMLDEGSTMVYTDQEEEQIMNQAERLERLSVGFSEGWKVLNRDLGMYLPVVLVLISLVLMPLLADDSQTKMRELCRSTRYGKRRLNHARVVTAYLAGMLLYAASVLVYFVIKIFPFGLDGWDESIQSSADTFFSVYNMTYLGQFLVNCLLGFAALIFSVSLVVFITALSKKVMQSAVVDIFFWMLLLILEQVPQFAVNYWFANFMPLRMCSAVHYLTGNEVYRIAGRSVRNMAWCPAVALLLSAVWVCLSVLYLDKER